MVVLEDTGSGDARERVVSSAVVEFAFVRGAVGLRRPANSCVTMREACPGKRRRGGVTDWIGADCGGTVNDVVVVDNAGSSRVRMSEGAVGG